MRTGQTHYKCIQHKTGSKARFSGSKSRNNALHSDCCKVYGDGDVLFCCRYLPGIMPDYVTITSRFSSKNKVLVV